MNVSGSRPVDGELDLKKLAQVINSSSLNFSSEEILVLRVRDQKPVTTKDLNKHCFKYSTGLHKESIWLTESQALNLKPRRFYKEATPMANQSMTGHPPGLPKPFKPLVFWPTRLCDPHQSPKKDQAELRDPSKIKIHITLETWHARAARPYAFLNSSKRPPCWQQP